MKYYVLQVRSGKETEIIDRLTELNISAFTPKELIHIRQRGEWREVEKVMFPCYVFVKAEKLDSKLYYEIKGVTNVIRFLGDGNPLALTDDDVEFVQRFENDGMPLEQMIISRSAAILPAPLQNAKDIKILRIDSRQRRARISVTLFGITHYITIGAV